MEETCAISGSIFQGPFLFIGRNISSRLLNFTIAWLFRPLSSDFNLCDASIFCVSTGASFFSKMVNTVFYKSICSIIWGIPEISALSLLQDFSLSQHFLSNFATLSSNLLLTFLKIFRSDSSYVNLVFKHSCSESILISTVSNIFW